MDRYLQDKFIGKYRILAEIDSNTNDFPREQNGSINQSICDFYIKCNKKIKIFHYGGNILEAYIPSLGTGRNIVRAIKTANLQDKIFNIDETDSEVIFKFKCADMESLEEFLKPSTFGAGISPLSTKNLPKEKYDIPPVELDKYKAIISNIEEGNTLVISHITDRFLNSVLARKYKLSDINVDIKKQKLARNKKGYIHKMGMWDSYLKYLEKELETI